MDEPLNLNALNTDAAKTDQPYKIAPIQKMNEENTFKVKIANLTITALIDTGASISCMSKSLSDQLDTKVEPYEKKIVGPDGSPLIIEGKSNVKLKMDEFAVEHELIVVTELSPQVILGRDFLKKHKAIIDCEKDHVILVNVPTEDFFLETDKDIHAVAIEDTLVPGNSIAYIKIRIPPQFDHNVLISNDPLLTQKKNIWCTRCIVDSSGNQLGTWLLNPGNETCKVLKGSSIGICEELEPSMKVCCLNNTVNQKEDQVREQNFIVSSKLSDKQKNKVLSLLNRYESIITNNDECVGKTTLIKHRIITQDSPPVHHRPYRTSVSEREIIKSKVEEMLNNGIITPSSSPWSSPVVLVKKKNGDWRFCIDYRKLNLRTVRDVYPLPRIDDTLDALGGSAFFSALDLKNGYWQIEVDERDREKTAFVTPNGLYQFNVMPFGLCNAPSTFERLMDSVLRNLTWEICLCYLDDIIVFSTDFDSHLDRLEKVLECIKTAGLTLNRKKCRFAFQELTIFGHVISSAGIKPDPEKTAPIQRFPKPKNVKQVQSFLGVCSYYRRFIPNFAKIAHPLHQLVRKNIVFSWEKAQNNAFEILKEKLFTAPVLTHYNPKNDIQIHTDASNLGLGAVMIQMCNGLERPVAYASRSLSKAEANYSTTEKECLAVIWAIGKFRPYVYGRAFTVITDHHSLCWLSNLGSATGRLARWSLKLQEFDITVKFKSGRKHQDADGLSRCPIPENEESQQIKMIAVEDTTGDPFIETIKKSLSQVQPELSMTDNFILRNNLLYKKNPLSVGNPWLLVIPKSMQHRMMSELHDIPTSGHLGIAKTYNRARKKFFWPNLYKTIRAYIASCP